MKNRRKKKKKKPYSLIACKGKKGGCYLNGEIIMEWEIRYSGEIELRIAA